MVTTEWRKFRASLLSSILYSKHEFEKCKSRLSFTLHFNEEGQLVYVFYNWLDGIEFPKMTNYFQEFTAIYDFINFPQGSFWSQCGTVELNRKKLKKASKF